MAVKSLQMPYKAFKQTIKVSKITFELVDHILLEVTFAQLRERDRFTGLNIYFLKTKISHNKNSDEKYNELSR